ncbi:MAG: YicC/YloC family endoribonuclease [Spirochaetota bacterium]
MISMTGYGASEFEDEQVKLSTEIKSYNNRYLEISFYMPSNLSVFEAEMRTMIRSRVSRGHVDVNIRVKQLESDAQVHVDTSLAARYAEAFRKIANEAGISEEPGLAHILQAEGVVTLIKDQNVQEFREVLFNQLSLALDEFCLSREKEGEQTKRDIGTLLESFEKAFVRVDNLSDQIEKKLYETLVGRFEQLLGNEYDQARILQEVGVLLVKYSVNEELERISTHLKHVYEILAQSSSAVGKKLDFLCQELNREVNTIASKSPLGEVNAAVVQMKEHLENIREQLRNVE